MHQLGYFSPRFESASSRIWAYHIKLPELVILDMLQKLKVKEEGGFIAKTQTKLIIAI